MGATTFEAYVGSEEGETTQQAFATARERALHLYGHGGYTGSVAEKDDFAVVSAPVSKERADEIIQRVYGTETYDHETGEPVGGNEWADLARKIDDKWGPAGCIPLEDGGFIFFGWASC